MLNLHCDPMDISHFTFVSDECLSDVLDGHPARLFSASLKKLTLPTNEHAEHGLYDRKKPAAIIKSPGLTNTL